MKIIKKVKIPLLVFSSLLGQKVLAANQRLRDYLNVARQQSGYEQVDSLTFFDTLVGRIISFVLGFIGIIFFILIIYSGIQWMTAGGNEEKVKEARKRIINSIIGLGLVLAAYVISYAIFKFFFEQTLTNP